MHSAKDQRAQPRDSPYAFLSQPFSELGFQPFSSFCTGPMSFVKHMYFYFNKVIEW